MADSPSEQEKYENCKKMLQDMEEDETLFGEHRELVRAALKLGIGAYEVGQDKE